jgi:hypothetical protein
MTYDDLVGPFDRAYKEFLLRRVVHDLGNSISGINSLSDYHLRSGVNDPVLEESLALIRESAELARELLVAVGTLLQTSDGQEELVSVQSLIVDTSKVISLLLPRSVKFETSCDGHTDAVISILRDEFVRKILSLVAMEVVDLRVPSGSMRLSWVMHGTKAQIRFLSTIQSASPLRERAVSFLAELSPGIEVKQVAEEGAFSLSIDVPLVESVES